MPQTPPGSSSPDPDPSPFDHIVDDVDARRESADWAYDQLAAGRRSEDVLADLIASGWPSDDAESIAEDARKRTQHLRGVVTRQEVAQQSEKYYRDAMRSAGGTNRRLDRTVDLITAVAEMTIVPDPAAGAARAGLAPPATTEQQWSEWARAHLAAGRPQPDVVADLVAQGWPTDQAGRLVAGAAAGPQLGYAGQTPVAGTVGRPRRRSAWPAVLLMCAGVLIAMVGVMVALSPSTSDSFLRSYVFPGVPLVGGLVILGIGLSRLSPR